MHLNKQGPNQAAPAAAAGSAYVDLRPRAAAMGSEDHRIEEDGWWLSWRASGHVTPVHGAVRWHEERGSPPHLLPFALDPGGCGVRWLLARCTSTVDGPCWWPAWSSATMYHAYLALLRVPLLI